jgi:hypothetical protein
MLTEQKRIRFERLKTFSHLNGRKKQELMVGYNTDRGIAEFWFRSRVKHNWRSQWHTRYKCGYVEFENGKIFDLENQTIDSKRVFLFPITPEVDILWHRQTLEDKINCSIDEMRLVADRLAAAQLIQETAAPKGDNQSFGRPASLAPSLGLSMSDGSNPLLSWYVDASLALLPALSLSQLEDLAELFDMPSDARPQLEANCAKASPLRSARGPLTRPATAGESAVAGHPLPAGEGCLYDMRRRNSTPRNDEIQV